MLRLEQLAYNEWRILQFKKPNPAVDLLTIWSDIN